MASMARRVSRSCPAARVGAVLAILACLSGCGSGAHRDVGVSVSADVDPSPAPARPPSAAGPPAITPRSLPASCARKAMQVLSDVATRVYREGVQSERAATAEYFIDTSLPLRQAVEHGDAAGVRAAARALIAAGRITNLRISRTGAGSSGAPSAPLGGGQLLADVGPPALAPIPGTLTGAGDAPIASFLTSVWSDTGFVLETEGITQGFASLRQAGRSLPGSLALAPGPLPSSGMLSLGAVHYHYASFPVTIYPSGRARVYLLRSDASLLGLCGASEQDTLVNTLRRVAALIYESESGAHALQQVRRVQYDPALLSAVASRDPLATREAIEGLLHEHVVRLRVSAGGRLLSDVGGPYVLAPVSASLREDGRQIGSFVLSIQDDEGYKRLAQRLAGVRVLMYMGTELVKNSLGPAPGEPPAEGPYTYRGERFRTFTIHAEAFPSGPLRIVALVPIPYS